MSKCKYCGLLLLDNKTCCNSCNDLILDGYKPCVVCQKLVNNTTKCNDCFVFMQSRCYLWRQNIN